MIPWPVIALYLGCGSVFLISVALIRKRRKGFLPITEYVITRRPIDENVSERIIHLVYLILLVWFWFIFAVFDLCIYLNLFLGNIDVESYFQEARRF